MSLFGGNRTPSIRGVNSIYIEGALTKNRGVYTGLYKSSPLEEYLSAVDFLLRDVNLV